MSVALVLCVCECVCVCVLVCVCVCVCACVLCVLGVGSLEPVCKSALLCGGGGVGSSISNT